MRRMDCNVDWAAAPGTAKGIGGLPKVLSIVLAYFPLLGVVYGLLLFILEKRNIVMKAHGLQGALLNIVWLVGNVLLIWLGPFLLLWNLAILMDIFATMGWSIYCIRQGSFYSGMLVGKLASRASGFNAVVDDAELYRRYVLGEGGAGDSDTEDNGK